MSWPEVIKEEGPDVSTAICDYEYRPYRSSTTYVGKTSVNANTLGSRKVVYCSAKSKYKPGQVKLTEFEATSEFSSGDDVVFSYTTPHSYLPAYMKLSGKVTSMFGVQISNTIQNPSPVFLPWDGVDQAIMKAVSNAKGAEGDVGMMLAEAKETVSFLLSPVKSLVKNLRRLYRSAHSWRISRSNPKSILDALSSLWMANRYGLKPLLSDISFLMGDLSKIQRRAELLRAHAGITIQDSDTLELLSGYNTVLICNFYKQLRTESRRSVHATALYKDYWEVGEFFWMVERLGLDCFSIPNLIWEMIPFSFVLDWVWNVGDWLGYHTPKWGRQTCGTTVSIKDVTTKSVEIYKCESIYGTPVPPPRGRHSLVLETINRFPNPIIDAGIHLTGESLSLNRRIDALSLTWQNLPKLFRKR